MCRKDDKMTEEIEDIVLLAEVFDVLKHIERKYNYVKKKFSNTDKYIGEMERLFKKLGELVSLWNLYLKDNKDEARKVFMALKKDTNV